MKEKNKQGKEKRESEKEIKKERKKDERETEETDSGSRRSQRERGLRRLAAVSILCSILGKVLRRFLLCELHKYSVTLVHLKYACYSLNTRQV